MSAPKFAKPLLLIALLCCLYVAKANMASPYRLGTSSATAFSSRNIDILSERLYVKLFDKDPGAQFRAEYNIFCDSAGKQVPLLFYAIRPYKDDFRVWVDGKAVDIKAMPFAEDSIGDYIRKFPYPLDTPYDGAQPMIFIKWDSSVSKLYEVRSLKYFEIDLSKGNHTIVVEYLAQESSNRSDWVMKYFVDYSLMPAKFWKSFGGLDIFLDATELSANVKANLPAPDSGDINNIAKWHFAKLPTNELRFEYTPQISSAAQKMISIGPEGLALGAGLVLFCLHILGIRRWRLKNPDKKYSWVVAVGSFLVPMLAMIFYMYAFDIIDNAIGDAAGRYHGYTFFVFLLFPFAFFGYLLVAWLIDRFFKKRYATKMA